MSLQPDSENSGSQQTAVPFGFAGKSRSSDGPETVINPERRGLVPSDSRELAPSSLAKRRRLFPGNDSGSDETPAGGQAQLGPAGVELAHFVVEEPIGRGGMGSVYRAVDTRLQRVVALKVLSPDQAQTQNAVQRFVNEARASARLDHDNIARVYFVGEDDGLHFIAYEYVTGTNIRDLIYQTGRLDPAEAINYTLQIAAALKHTSAAGVVHRDVKPSNIIVTPVGRAKLVDLGLARKEYTESVDELTVAGTTLGTFDYISPEQAKDPRNVDVRSDIYSLGCTLYQMLTGEPPYPEGTMYQKLLKHDGKEPPDPARKNGLVPPELTAVVRKMMASDPERRYRDADELIRDLMTVAGGMGIRTVSPDGLVWSAEMTRRPAGFWRRHLGWMATAAALVLIVFLLDRYDEKLKFALVGIDPAAAANGPGAVPAGNGVDATAIAGLAPDGAGPEGPSTADGALTGDEYSQQHPGPPGSQGVAALTPQQLPTVAGVSEANKADLDPAVPLQVPAEQRPEPKDDRSGGSRADSVAEGEVKPPGNQGAKSPSAEPATTARTTAPERNAPETKPPATEAQPEISLDSTVKAYSTLEAACVDAKDGSVIVLRYNGKRPEAEKKPLRLNDKKITIRGEEGFRPVIEFQPTEWAGEMPTRLITLIGGSATSVDLINVDLVVVLPETVDSGLEWALFSLRGAEQVRLTNVRVTFENAASGSPASVFELTSGPSGKLDMKMMKNMQPGLPEKFKIELTDSFIRGDCDLFHVAHTRPGSFSIKQSAVAIDETLLSIVGDLEMPADDAHLELQMEDVTGLLGNGLIRWNSGGEARNVLPVHVTSRNNIFSTNSPLPLIGMSGNTDPQDFLELLRWTGEWNFYDRFDTFWAVSSELGIVNERFDFDRWKSYLRPTERDAFIKPVGWKSAWWNKKFSELGVDDLMLDEDAPDNRAIRGARYGRDAGADLLKLPRRPQPQKGPEPSAPMTPGGAGDSGAAQK